MRKPSQAFLDMQMSIKDAKDHLLAMSQLLTGWKQCNQVARTHLATAAEWETEKTARSNRGFELSPRVGVVEDRDAESSPAIAPLAAQLELQIVYEGIRHHLIAPLTPTCAPLLTSALRECAGTKPLSRPPSLSASKEAC